MNRRAKLWTPRPAAGRERRGFSFTEVLFAVMILGIGFIMVAGIFPVAIAQTQSTGDDTVGASVARGGVEYVSRLPGLAALPADGIVHLATDAAVANGLLWGQVRGDLIQPEDPRYAFVPFFRRPLPVPGAVAPSYCQVIVIAVRNRLRGNYDPQADLNTVNAGAFTLGGRSIGVTLTKGGNNADTVSIDNSGGAAACAAPGAFIVIANGVDVSGRPAAGRIYRLGNELQPVGNSRVFELQPGSDLSVLPGPDGVIGTADDLSEATSGSVLAYIVGRGYNPDTGLFDGPAQDVAAYTSFVRIK